MVAPKNTEDLPDEIRPTVAAVISLFDEIYLVGGAVRDSILQRSTTDLDFTTPEKVEDIYSKLKNNTLFSVRDDARAFGTISARIGLFDIQITTFRDEQYTDGSRKPVVIPIRDVDDDLSRRDFTINAIALSAEELIDPYDGLRDIESKIIRALGDPTIRFREDPLRILRAFRFVSSFGFDIETSTLEGAQKLKENIRIVSRERVGVELRKLMEGDYWADSLNELADSGVFNAVFGHLGASYSIKGSDTRHEFDKYSTKSLENLSLSQRWAYLIDIMHYAAGSSGISSITKLSIAEQLVHAVQLPKKQKEEILDATQASEHERAEATNSTRSDSDQLHNMKESYTSLKAANDPKWMIEGAKYFNKLGRQSLREGKFLQAKKNFYRAIEISEKNYEYLFEYDNAEKKNHGLRGIKPYYLDRLKYLYIAFICDQKLFEKYTSINSVRNYLRKQNISKYASKQDKDATIDQAIAHVYKLSPRSTIVDSFDDFLQSSSTNLSPSEKNRLTQDSIRKQLKEVGLSPKDKAHLYKKKMKLSIASKGPEERRGLEYYDPYIDYIYNSMLTSKNISEFNDRHDEFNTVADTYLQLMSESGNRWQGERNIYLTSAAAHVFALTLTKSINEKLDLSSTIVRLYLAANSKLNADRYRIYENWFRYTEALLASNGTKDDLSKLLEVIKSTRHSLKYVDPDEEYLASSRPTIVEKRDLLRDSLALVAMLNKQTISDLTIKNTDIRAISTLFESDVCDTAQTFNLYKRVIRKAENQTLEPDHIEDNDRSENELQPDILAPFLIGEGETIEYKSSWSLDVDRYHASKQKQKISDKEITKSAIKNIAGFMNKRGGTLLIGVNDDCVPIGLENTDLLLSSSKDPRKALDNLQQSMRNDISKALGSDIFNRLGVEIIKYRPKITVLKITVPISDPSTPCLYKEGSHEIYFVRSGTICENAGIQAAISRMKNAV